MKKNIVFCLLTVICAGFSFESNAVEFLRSEDESILWEVKSVNSARGELDRLIDEEKIKKNRFKSLSRGEPIQPIAVPQNDVPIYEDSLNLGVSPDTPRNVKYPVGKERDAVDSWRRQWINFDEIMNGQEEPVDVKREQLVAKYKKKIDSCKDNYGDELDLEIETMASGSVVRNTSYLTNTMQNMVVCYKDVGYYIVDSLYAGSERQNDRLEEELDAFVVGASSPFFDTKYCGESCSIEALAKAQRDKFDEFRDYLIQLVDDAPMENIEKAARGGIDKIEEVKEDELLMIDDDIYIDDKDIGNQEIYIDEDF